VSDHNKLISSRNESQEDYKMNETTSPTNLNADLDSSAEQTNNTSNSGELISELPSAIRTENTNSFSPNMEHFNSPPAPQTDETEDATARLIRIRDELAQQLRDRDAESRQMDSTRDRRIAKLT
jgi:hypothetical protein